jgi:hypothetical protein
MTSAPATHWNHLAIILVLLFTGCDRTSRAVSTQVVDLADEFDRAERRPPAGFDVTVHVVDGIARPAIVMPVPGRAIWSLRVPRNGVLRTFVALENSGESGLGVRFRLGISDHRVSETLATRTLTKERGWTELAADLSAFAGFKWSLFYRPDEITWRILLATDDLGNARTRALWGSPEILTDAQSARDYQKQREVR